MPFDAIVGELLTQSGLAIPSSASGENHVEAAAQSINRQQLPNPANPALYHNIPEQPAHLIKHFDTAKSRFQALREPGHRRRPLTRSASEATYTDFKIVEDSLYEHQILIFKNQSHVTPKAQYEVTQRFDPDTTATYGHGKTLDAKRSILHPDLKTIPHQKQVQVIGNGFVEEYEGLSNIQLRHPHHRSFHATKIPEEDDLDFTRFYRWHIDAALYDLAPPVVTSLFAVRVPAGRTQTLRYDDGSGDEMQVPLGTTAFASGYAMYDLLTPEDKEFARTTKVEYAPHPYIWMSPAKSRSTGLGLLSEGKELPASDLPEVDDSKVQLLPMCWRNPKNGRLALQIHPSAIAKLHLKDGRIIDDLGQVRDIVYHLQRPGIAPDLVYSHDWEEGDFVLFHNRGLIHSVVGAFAENEVRLFRQCNIAASQLPQGPTEVPV